jgi:hypothetical protein
MLHSARLTSVDTMATVVAAMENWVNIRPRRLMPCTRRQVQRQTAAAAKQAQQTCQLATAWWLLRGTFAHVAHRCPALLLRPTWCSEGELTA